MSTMVSTFDRTPYGLRMTFKGGTAQEGVKAFMEQGGTHFAQLQPGWRLVVDLREAPMMSQDDFARMAGFMGELASPPARIATIVNSAIFAMQLRRLSKSIGMAEIMRVIEAEPGPAGMQEAEAFAA